MMDCRHRSGLHGRTCLNGASIVIHNCSQHQICTIDPSELLKLSGEPVAACAACPQRDPGEPVGSILSDILFECGITRKACLPCQDWIAKMNRWGIEGCEHHRAEILERLNEAAGEATWAEWGTVAWGGYGSTNAILNEAIKRAKLKT